MPPVAAVLSLLTLLAVVARMALSFRENLSHLAVSTHQALTDPLTGLGNRRRLMADLEETTARPREPGEVCLMVVFDLDGFKAYNDAFGHPAGDALLAPARRSARGLRRRARAAPTGWAATSSRSSPSAPSRRSTGSSPGRPPRSASTATASSSPRPRAA